MNYYAVIDTNVLVSAMLKWNSVPGTIMELTFDGVIVPVFNTEILTEYRAVLSRPKFHLNNDIIEDIVEEIERIGINVEHSPIPVPKDSIMPNALNISLISGFSVSLSSNYYFSLKLTNNLLNSQRMLIWLDFFGVCVG